MMAALAEFERALIVERAQAGLVAAKSRGVRLGRPKKLTVKQIRHERVLRDGGETGHAVAQALGVSRATLYRVLAAV